MPVRALTFVYVILNHPPKTPQKRLGATTFVRLDPARRLASQHPDRCHGRCSGVTLVDPRQADE
jgi:hypothetical protein